MARIPILEAVSLARRELLPIGGVVGVGYSGETIIVYVETPEAAARIPRTYRGYPVVFKVTGRLTLR